MISIVTVCHNSGRLLPYYVNSFLEHNAALANVGQVEFVFVENSGDPDTEVVAARLRERGFAVQVAMVENRGFGSGCNAGARLAQGRLLVFANPDIRFLTPIMEIDTVFVGDRWGTIRQVRDDKLVCAFDLLPEYRSLATELLRPFRYLHKLPRLARYCYPVGSFMIVPREAFLTIGGFDERFFLYYEEAELSRRLIARFGPPKYRDGVSILHEGFGTQSSLDFTFREEARGLVTYSHVTEQPALVEARIRTLKRLSPFSETAAARIRCLERAMEETR